MKTKQDYAAMVPDLAERENGGALYAAWLKKEADFDEGVEGVTEADVDAADAAYSKAPGGSILDGDNKEGVERCALSGAALYTTDDLLEFNGRYILASLLLDPDQIAHLTAEDEDDIEEAA